MTTIGWFICLAIAAYSFMRGLFYLFEASTWLDYLDAVVSFLVVVIILTFMRGNH